MTTLFNKYLCEREFGSAVLHVETFQKWAVAKGLHLRTAPALGEYEFAQVESLLCAIERGAAPQTPEDARAIIDSKPELAGHNVAVRFPEPDHSHVWLVGAEAHLQWRRLIERAITDDELQLLDGASYLPVSSRLAASPEAPKSNEQNAVRVKRALVAEVICFWPTIELDLSDSRRNGLHEVAKHHKHGFWYVEPAIKWATECGKVTKGKAQTFIASNEESHLSPMLRSLLKLD